MEYHYLESKVRRINHSATTRSNFKPLYKFKPLPRHKIDHYKVSVKMTNIVHYLVVSPGSYY